MDAESPSMTSSGSDYDEKAKTTSLNQRKRDVLLFSSCFCNLLLIVVVACIWQVQMAMVAEQQLDSSQSEMKGTNLSFPRENLDKASLAKILQSDDDIMTGLSRTRRSVITATPKSAHLYPRSTYLDSVTDLARQTPILWSSLDHQTYTRAHNTLFEIRNDGWLQVRETGRHYIYLHLTFNGKRQAGQSAVQYRHCQFQTIVKPRGSSTQELLMTLSTTQIEGGRALDQATGGDNYPWDSNSQGGIFPLNEGDRIWVLPSDHSQTCRIAFHPEKSFFGGFLIQ